MNRIERSHSPLRLTRLLGILSLLLLTYPLHSRPADRVTGAARSQDPLARYLRRYESAWMTPSEVAQRVRAGGEFRVATQTEIFDFVLEPHDVRAPGYLAEEVAGDGRVLPVSPAPQRTYRGAVPGHPGSEARFSVSDELVEGVIITAGEWYFVEPRRNFEADADPSEFIVYRMSDILPDAVGTCGTTLAERVGEARGYLDPLVMAESGAAYVAEVATEADFEYVTACGSASSANSAILDIMNQVDGIYQTQLGITLQVSYQHAWSTADDPFTSTSPSTRLTEFRSYWNSNLYSRPYDLAHMWTGSDLDGSVIGIAYLDVVCSARSYSYGISQRLTSSPAKYILTAHEMGHNFGANHTDTTDPAQADCANTIMNSSIGTGTAFCPYSRSEIAAYLAQSSSCLATGPAAPSNLTATVVPPTQIRVAWQDNSGTETGFRIERKAGSSAPWGLAATTEANVTSYSDMGLTAGMTYYYRVQATSASGSSAYSNEASATIPSQAPTISGMLPSSAPTGASVTITGTNFTGATAVRFNGINAQSFTVTSPTQITAVVPPAATSGKISVVTPWGTALSASDFVVLTCSFGVSPLSVSFPPASAGGSISVTAGSGCSWTAASHVSWVTMGFDGSGSGSANFAVAANTTGSYRSGTLTVAGRTVSVAQAGVGCDLNIDGAVNVLDIQSLINAVLGIGSTPAHYDLSRDGSVNVLDLQQLANVILGINTCP